jgi:hypothetical protein
MEMNNMEGKGRRWTTTCAAEVKAWVASVMFWSAFKCMSFVQFYNLKIDSGIVKLWFPSQARWEQMKRFFKTSDPKTDSNHKEDRLWRVRELFEYFNNACKANYYPVQQVAVDEAIKKFKGRCTVCSRSILRTSPSGGASRFSLSAVQ